ncbi:hypothetical protein EV424DRAFT_1346481 [Suillus variegatus]|nr:hypothetical protein EV424DRAFT_1346481 [Suillus variegatus]
MHQSKSRSLILLSLVLDQDSGVYDGTGNLICSEDVWSYDLVTENPSFDVDFSTISLSPSVDYLMSNNVLDSLVSRYRKNHHYACQSNIYEKPEHVKLPTAGGPPVQMIVQYIFTTIGNLYFEVGQNVVPSARPNLKSTLKATFLSAVELSLVVPANTKWERTFLMHFMGWDKFEVELQMNPAQKWAAEQI